MAAIPLMNSLASTHSKTRKAYNLAAQKYHDLFHNEIHEKEYDWKMLDLRSISWRGEIPTTSR